MITPKVAKITGALALLLFCGLTYQNCAKAHFNDPDARHSAIALGLCRICEDASGSGLSCRTNITGDFSNCIYESCNPGFLHSDNEHTCTPVICEPGTQAICEVDHGQGTMACASSTQGYGTCHASECEEGYVVQGNNCVPVNEENPDPDPAPLCEPNSHRDCSTDSNYGSETCNEDGSAYGPCVFEGCKPGYYAEGGEIGLQRARILIASAPVCTPQVCDPGFISPCTVGEVGTGFETCNSNGSGFGVCVLEGCTSGFLFKGGVCEEIVCTAGETTGCEFDHGTGERTCAADGTGWGECIHKGCANGFYEDAGNCKENKCTPSSQDTCEVGGGTGTMYCYENGSGHGPCTINHCPDHFKVKNNKCVGENTCTPDEVIPCDVANGIGKYECKSDNTIGACIIQTCNTGYTKKVTPGNTFCKKD